MAARLLHAPPQEIIGDGDLAWLPPFFSFSPPVTCKIEETQQAHMFSVFFLFRFVSLQIFLFFSPSSPLLQMAGDNEEGRTREGQADRGVIALRNPLERTDRRPLFLLWSAMNGDPSARFLSALTSWPKIGTEEERLRVLAERGRF